MNKELQRLINETNGHFSETGLQLAKDLVNKGQDIDVTPKLAARLQNKGFIIVGVEENRGDERVTYAIYNNNEDAKEREADR